MGARRCAATTKAGVQCKAQTRHGEYCWIHLAQLRGVRIKMSEIPEAGKGLYAARDFKKGDIVARYTGDQVPTGGDHDGSAYVLELSEAVSIDAARTNTAEGRMINDSRGSGKRNNCRFSCNQAAKTAVLRATQSIAKGRELFVGYGRNFWPGRAGGAKGSIAAKAGEESDGAGPAPAAAAAAPAAAASAARAAPAPRAKVAAPQAMAAGAAADGDKQRPIVLDLVSIAASTTGAVPTYASLAKAWAGTCRPQRRTA